MLAECVGLHSTKQRSELQVGRSGLYPKPNKIHSVDKDINKDQSCNEATVTIMNWHHACDQDGKNRFIHLQSRRLTWKVSVLSSVLKDSQFLPLLAALWSRDPRGEAGGVLKAACRQKHAMLMKGETSLRH